MYPADGLATTSQVTGFEIHRNAGGSIGIAAGRRTEIWNGAGLCPVQWRNLARAPFRDIVLSRRAVKERMRSDLGGRRPNFLVTRERQVRLRLC